MNHTTRTINSPHRRRTASSGEYLASVVETVFRWLRKICLMKTLTKLLTLAVIAWGLSSMPASAVVVVLKIDGIQGESLVDGHAGEIDLATFKLSLAQSKISGGAGATGGAAASSPVLSPMIIYKYLDKASVKLMVACALGTHFPTATLTVASTPADMITDVFKVKLSGVTVSSADMDKGADSESDTFIMETVALSYTKIEWTYFPRNPDGTPGTPVTGGYDTKTRRALTPAPIME